MENEIYIASKVASTLKTLSLEQQNLVAKVIDSLSGDGWQQSQVLADGGGLRTLRSGDVRVLFRYAPEEKAIIVVDVNPRLVPSFAMAS